MIPKPVAVAMLPVALAWLAKADTVALVKDAGDACRELIPNVEDRRRLSVALGGLAKELER